MSSKTVNINGDYYNHLSKLNSYSTETKNCIRNTVEKLINHKTSTNNPGLFLGDIQSGKTRTFIGTIALAFDNSYDMAIVLTKGTKALTKQTHYRLIQEFKYFYENDTLQVFDIMGLPDNLTRFELDQKTIFVVKKEKNNLIRLQNALFQKYPFLAEKKILIIDDEADFASIGFVRVKKEIVNLRSIAKEINELRQNLKKSDFLQVTATPYALYLQPKNLKDNDFVFKPLKPAFTEIVPLSKGYVGGEFYFNKGKDINSLAYHLYQQIPLEELSFLKRPNIEHIMNAEILRDNRIKTLRYAIMNFIVGGAIRRLQQKEDELSLEKYSFVIHTEQKKLAHEWQKEIIHKIKMQLYITANQNPSILTPFIEKSYNELVNSLLKTDSHIPEFDNVRSEVTQLIQNDHIMITTVNSEKDVNELLDDTGQLRLRVPFNIFIGGQILDRGITVKNLIGFYYGRNPKKFQQDTVLQHSRMYGYRPKTDLAVTRFYTTDANYKVMNKIYELDNALREAITKGTDNNGVVFIKKDDTNKIIPCSPNKIVISEVTTLKPLKRLLPIGFQTKSNSSISKLVTKIDKIVDNSINGENEPVLIDIEIAKEITKNIYKTFSKNKKLGEQWDVEAFIAGMEYLAKNIVNQNNGKVWLITRRGRNIARYRKSTGRYEDAPDTASGTNNELNVAKRIAIDNPVLILTRQQGLKSQQWNEAEFWWPVLLTPMNTPPVIYTSKTHT
jgi:hypothetical protein